MLKKTPSILVLVFCCLILQTLTLETAIGFERSCEDSPWNYPSDGVLCIWIRNDSKDTIIVTDFYPYSNHADLNDDYYKKLPQHIHPGQMKPIASIDDQGWGVFNYKTVKFRADIRINSISNAKTTGAYVKADLAAGIVSNFEFGFNYALWFDNDFNSVEHYPVGGNYRLYYTDAKNHEAVFTYRNEHLKDNTNMGYVLADTSTDNNKLNVMSYNTYLLTSDLGGKPDYCDRAKQINSQKHRIFNNVDVLILQELASRTSFCSPDARQLAVDNYLCCDGPFYDRTELLNGEPLVTGPAGPENTGGVVIMSKYPNSLHGVKKQIDFSNTHFTSSDEVHYLYRASQGECSGGDCYMDKGFLKVKMTKGQEEYYIFGTHAQSNPGSSDKNARKKQWNAIRKHIDTLPHNSRIIIAGDMNTENPEISTMKSLLNADEFGKNSNNGEGLNYSYDHMSNAFSKDGSQNKYDWVLYSRDGQTPEHMTWRYLPITGNFRNYLGGDLSDHHAVIAEFEFAPYPPNTVDH